MLKIAIVDGVANSIADRVRDKIRAVPDFPSKGILFRDITPVLLDHELTRESVSLLADPFRHLEIDYVVGIESRGFIFGVLLAQELKAGFAMVRKAGKLPCETISANYDLEYGSATIEMHRDDIRPGSRVLIHDDLLATGGTAKAASALIGQSGSQVAGFSFLVELKSLGGREQLRGESVVIASLIEYE
ncbi:MAG: adenine phosphoribosyltransferase [Salibacteraceae bacterium]